jgi:glycosyltransferase involved in cell wall biosynthesis
MESGLLVKKIAIVLNSSWQGYNFRLNLARELRDNNYKVVFIAAYDQKYSEILKKEFDFFPLEIDATGRNLINDFKMIISLHKIFKDINPDIVLNFTIKPNIYGSIVAGISGIKSISNITGLGSVFINPTISTKLVKFLYYISLLFSNKVFFQNEKDMLLFVKSKLVRRGKVILIPGSGVDLNKFTPVKRGGSNKTFSFLLISRLIKDKGVLEYIEAAKIIKNEYDDVVFKILGSIEELKETAIKRSELDSWIGDNIIDYLGVSDEVQNVIAGANCVVLPSYREGLPRSLLEAGAMEKPVIATDVPGCSDVVKDGVNGFLCKAGDAKDLSNKMKEMLSLTEKNRMSMGKIGRKMVINNFNERDVIDIYLINLKEILG